MYLKALGKQKPYVGAENVHGEKRCAIMLSFTGGGNIDISDKKC